MVTREEDGGGVIVSESSSPIDSLPVDCISIIISLTSPRDACVAASVSKIFGLAVKSDFVWEKFLPPEYKSLFPRYRDFSSKRELYFSLCNNPVLFDDAKKSFWLEKASGKMCIMLSAMDCSILFGDNRQYWQWTRFPESRFEKVAKLRLTRQFGIRGKISSRFLSPRIRYSAYIVFKKVHCKGFEDLAIETGVGVVGEEVSKRLICFDVKRIFGSKHGRRKRLTKARKREDGWMEIELGEFFNEGGLLNCDEIEMSASETKTGDWKCGLIIQGIEIRPIKIL